jgi:hypothetical protein
MSIHRFFTKNIIVRRERELGSNKRGLLATATVDGYFQDLDSQERSMLGIITERAWRFWFAVEQDIKEGDILVDENNNEYYVREVTKKDIGINQHLEVLAVNTNV